MRNLSVVSMRENSFVNNGVERLNNCNSSYNLTVTKRSHCKNCRNCSAVACRNCPVKAEYDRLFDLLCDMEEAREERKEQRRVTVSATTSLGSLLSNVAI